MNTTEIQDVEPQAIQLEAVQLEAKVRQLHAQTLAMHKTAPGIRIASSLSPVETLVALFYGGLIACTPARPRHPHRDRFIASKGHGTLCLYPVLADLGFFDPQALTRIGQDGALLSVIPEQIVPGVETTNGSLGHGPGVACGVALGLKRRGIPATVYVLCGDGEMNSGAVWEAIMFAAHRRLDNLILIIDDNGRSMMGYQKDIMGLDPLVEKLRAFRWLAEEVDGHDVHAIQAVLSRMKPLRDGRPKAVIARTIKGHGVPELENDPLAHIRVLSPQTIDALLENPA
jgi:transketolase